MFILLLCLLNINIFHLLLYIMILITKLIIKVRRPIFINTQLIINGEGNYELYQVNISPDRGVKIVNLEILKPYWILCQRLPKLYLTVRFSPTHTIDILTFKIEFSLLTCIARSLGVSPRKSLASRIITNFKTFIGKIMIAYRIRSCT